MKPLLSSDNFSLISDSVYGGKEMCKSYNSFWNRKEITIPSNKPPRGSRGCR